MATKVETMDALERRLDDPALQRFDQGRQNRQKRWRARLAQPGVEQGMPRKATCLGDACMEGFFGRTEDGLCQSRRFIAYESSKPC